MSGRDIEALRKSLQCLGTGNRKAPHDAVGRHQDQPGIGHRAEGNRDKVFGNLFRAFAQGLAESKRGLVPVVAVRNPNFAIGKSVPERLDCRRILDRFKNLPNTVAGND